MNFARACSALLLALTMLHSANARPDEHVDAKPRTLMQRTLPEFFGKEALMLRVELPPGFIDPPHRHDAHVFVYVLEGTVEMQIEGSDPVVLGPGDTFYEDPRAVHVAGRNLSATQPATLIVFFVKDMGSPPVRPAGKG